MTCSEIGCTKRIWSRGLCGGHYSAARRSGRIETSLTNHRQQGRFWSNTKQVGECLEWQGKPRKNGYGDVKYKINGKWWLYPHRIAYFFHYDDDPGELMVCHTCDNRMCVKPEHLFLGTARDNLQDMADKGRRKGEKHAGSKLTEADVLYIRRVARVEKSLAELARQFHVSRGAISSIVHRKSWTHI